jgi:hypothetical protein
LDPREEVTGGWRRQHNEELHNVYYSRNIVRMIKSSRMRWTGHVAHMGEMRNGYTILVRKRERKRTLKRPRCRGVENIIMDLREVGWGGVECMHMAQDRDQWLALVNTLMNLRIL